MDTNFLFYTLGQVIPLSLGLRERFTGKLEEQELKKKEELLRPGQTCRRMYFIKEGFTRSYYTNEEGKECTGWFMGKGQLMMSVYSFYSQKPSYEYIEALEPTLLQSISYYDLQAVYADFPESNALGRILTEKYYMLSEERAWMLRTTTPEARYVWLLDNYPDIFQNAPLKYIASYMGITPETLSRLRAKLI